MDTETALGTAMSGRTTDASATIRVCVAGALACCLSASSAADAAERFALVVTGAAGGPQYAEKYDEWRSSVVQTLQGPLGLSEENVVVLAEEESSGTQKATRDNVRAAIADLGRRAGRTMCCSCCSSGTGAASTQTMRSSIS